MKKFFLSIIVLMSINAYSMRYSTVIAKQHKVRQEAKKELLFIYKKYKRRLSSILNQSLGNTDQDRIVQDLAILDLYLSFKNEVLTLPVVKNYSNVMRIMYGIFYYDLADILLEQHEYVNDLQFSDGSHDDKYQVGNYPGNPAQAVYQVSEPLGNDILGIVSLIDFEEEEELGDAESVEGIFDGLVQLTLQVINDDKGRHHKYQLVEDRFKLLTDSQKELLKLDEQEIKKDLQQVALQNYESMFAF